MIHILTVGGLFTLGAVLLALFQRRFSASERPYLWAGYLAHVGAAFAQVWIIRYYYGSGDMLLYHSQGLLLADWLRSDIVTHSVELAELLIQQAEMFRIPGVIVHGVGNSTGSMFAVAGFSSLLLGGSLYATCLLWSLFAFVGQIAIYLGFRDIFRPRFRRRLLIATLLIPTVVFWSGGLVKEAFAIGGFGLLFFAVQRLIYRSYRPGYVVLAAAGAICVALFKSYILFPFFLAAGAWFYWYRSLTQQGRIAVVSKPLYLVAAFVLAGGAVLAFVQFFPQYAPANLAHELAQTQRNALRTPGGSTFQMDVPETPSLTGQLRLLPLGLTTALLRPFIFEAHNAVALMNALETTLILALILWILAKRGPVGTFRTIAGSPAAVFCLVFVLLFATAVGLASPNLGTVSRYRIPMMPFYIALLFLLIPEDDR